MKKMFSFILLIFILVVAVSGCINQQQTNKELYNFTKDGVEYIFANNIYDTLKTNIEDSENIRKTMDLPLSVVVAFNGSSAEDNAYFSVVSYNTVEKLKNYYVYSKGRVVEFKGIDIKDNYTIPEASTIIVIKGPNTGADVNSTYYDNACIVNEKPISLFSRCVVIQGTDYKGLVQSSERFLLFVLGFDENDI